MGSFAARSQKLQLAGLLRIKCRTETVSKLTLADFCHSIMHKPKESSAADEPPPDRTTTLTRRTSFRFVLLLLPAIFSPIRSAAAATVCEQYNITTCTGTEADCTRLQICPPLPTGKRSYCYVLWTHDDVANTSTLSARGCGSENAGQCFREKCVIQRKIGMPVSYCCCVGDLCNRDINIRSAPKDAPRTTVLYTETKLQAKKENRDYGFVLVVVLLFFAVVVVILGLTLLFHKYSCFVCYNRNLPLYGLTSYLLTSKEEVNPVTLLSEIGRGRFGSVWKAEYENAQVAVKRFAITDLESWKTEVEIFKLPQMMHPSLLHFITSERMGADANNELWLVTAYHEKGSLYDYLRGHELSFEEVFKIAESMAKGLEHLHEAIPADMISRAKPMIAHRDFKSKNVLLKADMTACIADFGLALVFHTEIKSGDDFGMVGTYRYMAPELLDCAINLTKQSFLRVDMYAYALVVWETMCRWTDPVNPTEPYKMPFEKEVGGNPSLAIMQKTVLINEQRPELPTRCREHPILSQICETIEECWEQDSEARIPAGCVVSRFEDLRKSIGDSGTGSELGE